ncbi:MAG: nucleotidyl transferase AbiEii/AbiGii toxin family protein [Campylobacterota bacterium]|nr:nucleotidyl transferase AbiEii/AbiGii toxin family protein [Campylobacterota bacterium]
MEKEIDYTALYQVQDRVLDVVFALDNSFYLTGGTALHRFYYQLRYSDDLDFFTYADPLFRESIIEIIDTLQQKGITYRYLVESKDFHRLLIEESLQVDFVNDRVYRHSKSNLIDAYKIDNKTNILANKVTAILGRDEAKDIFDLFTLLYNEECEWSEVLAIAHKKSPIAKDELIYRIESFPLSWLEKIKIIQNIAITPKAIAQVCEDILNESSNSLVKE